MTGSRPGHALTSVTPGALGLEICACDLHRCLWAREDSNPRPTDYESVPARRRHLAHTGVQAVTWENESASSRVTPRSLAISRGFFADSLSSPCARLPAMRYLHLGSEVAF